jgi:hypothetical protein
VVDEASLALLDPAIRLARYTPAPTAAGHTELFVKTRLRRKIDEQVLWLGQDELGIT